MAVTEAADGRDAIARLTNEPFDLLILDLCMPVVDGVATLSMIRERPMLWHLPVVILSGERRSDAVESVIRLGIDDFLLKPLHQETTAMRLRAIIDRVADQVRERTGGTAALAPPPA